MLRKQVIGLFIIIGLSFLLPVESYGWWKWWHNLSTIVSPERWEKIDHSPVEIVVEFHEGANTDSFRAWLNGRNITRRFEQTDNGMRAMVGPDDGLRICVEEERHSKHKKSIFKKKTNEHRKCKHKGKNHLKTKVQGQKRKTDVDHRVFFVRISEPQHLPPIVDAGPDQEVYVGDTVQLDGSGSQPGGNDELEFQWSFTEAPGASSPVLSDPTSPFPTFVVPLPGIYTVQLIVNDGELYSEPDTVTIRTKNSPPVAQPQSVSTDEDTDLGITLTGSDRDGDYLTYQVVSEPLHGTLTGTPPNLTYTPTPDYNGPDSFTFTVFDGTVASAPTGVSITIISVNDAPVAQAGPDRTYTLSPGQGETEVTLDSSGSSDKDGDIASYLWTGTPDPKDAAQPSVSLSTGIHVFILLVTDDGGATSEPDSVTITVIAPPVLGNIPGETILEGESFKTVNLDDFVEDLDTADEKIAWSFSGASELTVTMDVNRVVTIDVPNENWSGSETVTFRATDPEGLFAEDSATFTVEERPLTITLTSPVEGEVFGSSPITVRGTVSDPHTRVLVQDLIATVTDTTFEIEGIVLTEGPNQLNASARNDAGEEATATRSVILDTKPPTLSIRTPTERSTITSPSVSIYGTVMDATAVTGFIDDEPMTIEGTALSGTVTLAQGKNVLNITCQDAAGNSTSRQLTLYLDTEPLAVTDISPANGDTDVAPSTSVTVTFSKSVDAASLSASTFYIREGSVILPSEISVSTDGLEATLASSKDLPSGATIDVTVTSGVTDGAGNPLAMPFLSRFTVSGEVTQPGVVVGEVYDDTKSLPLAGASVAALAPDSREILAQSESDERGRYLLAPERAEVLIRVTKPGFTPAERRVGANQGTFAEALDARLTPLSAPRTVQAVLGAKIQNALGDTLKIPPGAFDADGEVTFTPVSQQGPRAPFPPGWTPLGIADIGATESFDPPATLAIQDRSGVAAGMAAVFVRYDESSASWIVLASVTIPSDGTAEVGEVSGSGQFALLLPDSGEGSPIMPAVGEPLAAGSSIPLPDAIATAHVTPPVGRIDDPTPAMASVAITAWTPLRSSTSFRGDFEELFILRDGGTVAPLYNSQDLFAYRSPGDTEGRTLTAAFPIAPSVTFSPVEATEGTVTVTMLPSSAINRSLVGSSGGGFQISDRSRVTISPGALPGDVPIALFRLEEDAFPVATPAGFTFLGALELDLYGMTATSPLSITLGNAASRVPTGSTVVVAEPQTILGQERLVLIALARVDGYDITTVSEVDGVTLPGVRRGGSYGFYLFEGPLELIGGTAQDEAGRRDGMVMKIESMPFVSLTDATGSYTLLSPPGSFTLIATGAASQDQARIVGNTGTPLPDLVISTTPPQVQQITVRPPWIEGNFAGPVILLGKPAPVIDDDSSGQSSGNGNGEIDPGERIELSLAVRNDGTIAVEGGSLMLQIRGLDGPIAVAPETMDIDILEPQEAVFVGPFVFAVPSSLDPALLRYTFTYLNQQDQRLSQTSFRLPMDVDHPDVPVSSEVAVHFSEPVLTSSLETGFYLELEDGAEVKPVSAKLLIDQAGSVATLRPLASLDDNSVYRITLTQTIVDSDGRSLTGAPVVERFRTEDRTPPAAVDPGLIEALVPDDEGFVTISGSLGTINPDDTVTVFNQKTGLTVLATVEGDGSFVARIEATVTDRLSLIVSDASGNSTTIESVPFVRRDPVGGEIVSVVIGRDGGTVTSAEGINLEVPAGAVFRATEFSVSRLEEPFQLPEDIAADQNLVTAFEALFGVADRVQIQAKADRFAGAVHLSLSPPPNATEGDLFVLVRSRTVTTGGPLADLDHNTGLTAAENPWRTLERLEIVDTATVKDVKGEFVLSTDSPPFSGITGPGDFTWLRVEGPLTFLAGEVRRDSATGVPIAGAAVQSLPGAVETSPFAAVTDRQGRFVLADAGAGGTHQEGAVVASRLDVFDPEYNRVIRRDVRGVVSSPEPPHSVVAHLEEPFVLPATLPGVIIDILGDLEPPDLQVFVTGSSLTRGYGLVGDRLTVTVSATDNDEIAFVGLQVDQGNGSQPVSLGSNGTFDFTPSAEGLIRFRAQAHDRTGNTTFVDRNMRILQVDSQGQVVPPQSLPGQTPGLIQPPDESPEDGPGGEPAPAPLVPGAYEVSFDGDIVVLASEPLDPGTVNESTVEILDPEGNTVPCEVMAEFGDSAIRISPKSYLRLGARYTVRLSSGILDLDGESLTGTTLGVECPPPLEVATIDLPNATDVALIDQVRLGDDVLEDVLVATSYPVPVVDYGAIHLYQVRDKDDPDLLLPEPLLLGSAETYGLPESLAVDGSRAFVGNRWYGHLVMPDFNVSLHLAEASVISVGGFSISSGLWLPDISWHWGAGLPTPPSNLEVFDLSDPTGPKRLGGNLINAPPVYSWATVEHTWDPNTTPARVEITNQGVAVLNFLANIEMFTPTAQPLSLGVIEHVWSPLHDPGRCIAGPEAGMVCPYDIIPPFFRCQDDGSPRAWECVQSYEFYDTAFFDNFAVSIVGRSELTPNGGLRILPLVPPEEPIPRDSTISFYPMPKEVRVHVGGRVGAVPAFEWEEPEGTFHRADLAFVNTPQETPVPRLRIFDVTDPTSPVLLSVLDNVFGNMTFDSCRGLAYLYGGKIRNEITGEVINEGEFHVIDFNNPHDPRDLNNPGEGREPFQVKELGGGTIGYNAITNDDQVVYIAEEAGIAVVKIRSCTEIRSEAEELTRFPLFPISDGIVAFANTDGTSSQASSSTLPIKPCRTRAGLKNGLNCGSRLEVDWEDSEFEDIKLDPRNYYPDLGEKTIKVRAFNADDSKGSGKVRAEVIEEVGTAAALNVSIEEEVELANGLAEFHLDGQETTPGKDGKKQIKVEFSWTDADGRPRKDTAELQIKNNSNTNLREVLDGKAVFVATDEAGKEHAGVTPRPPDPTFLPGYDPTPRPRYRAPENEQRFDFVQEMLNQVCGRKVSAFAQMQGLIREDGNYRRNKRTEQALNVYKMEFAVPVNTNEYTRSDIFRKLMKDYSIKWENMSRYHDWIIDKNTLVMDEESAKDVLINPDPDVGVSDTGLYEIYYNVVIPFIETMIGRAEQFRDGSNPQNASGQWISRRGVPNPPKEPVSAEHKRLYDGHDGVAYCFGCKWDLEDFNRIVSRWQAPETFDILYHYWDYRGDLDDGPEWPGIIGAGDKQWPGLYSTYYGELATKTLDDPWNNRHWAGIDCAGLVQRVIAYAKERNPSYSNGASTFFQHGLAGITVKKGWWWNAVLSDDFFADNNSTRIIWKRGSKGDEPIHRGDLRVGGRHVSIVYSDPSGPREAYYLIHAYGPTPERYHLGLDGRGPVRFGRKVLVSSWLHHHTDQKTKGVVRIMFWE